MKIRSQLVLAFLFLAVLPLTGIVLYSYASSRRAVRQAVWAEAAQLTEEMQMRMASVQEDLKRRVERVGHLPFTKVMEMPEHEAEGERRAFMGRLLDELGEAAPLVRSFEFVPEPPLAPPAPLSPSPEEVPAPPEMSPDGDDLRASVEVRSVVIDVQEILREVEQGLQEIPEGPARDQARQAAHVGVEIAAAIAQGIDSLVEKLGLDESAEAALEAALEKRAGERFQGSRAGEAEAERRRGGIGDARRKLKRHRWWLEIDDQELIAKHRRLDAEQKRALALYEKELHIPVREQGRLIGEVKTEVSGEEILHRVLARTRRDQGEIPFAIDAGGNLYVADDSDRQTLEGLPLTADASDRGQQILENWVIVTSEDREFGLTFGIARPIRESLEELGRTTARNLGYGLGLIALALVGILPLSSRMTRNLKLVTAGAERIAQGDLEARVPVRTRNEIGQLARVFNRMAHDLEAQRKRLLDEERRRRDQEVEQQLLKAKYDRKSEELEDARRFQLSLLPRKLPTHASFEVAVFMKTATEVGGDYYDFRLSEDGTLICAIGDATGHGAKAGTMVTVIKSLFSASPPEASLSSFLDQAAAAIKRMDLGRMAMGLSLARLKDRRLTLSSAGMPPALLYRRASGVVEELVVQGMPLGSLDFAYRERQLETALGDTLLLMSDGFPELPNGEGEPLGYARVLEIFQGLGSGSPQEIIGGLSAAAEEWAGEEAPADDVTFVVLKVR